MKMLLLINSKFLYITNSGLTAATSHINFTVVCLVISYF